MKSASIAADYAREEGAEDSEAQFYATASAWQLIEGVVKSELDRLNQ